MYYIVMYEPARGRQDSVNYRYLDLDALKADKYVTEFADWHFLLLN